MPVRILMSNTLVRERIKAIKLRKEGRSYSQIKKELRVSKSSLSLWLRQYPLSEKRLRELRDFNEQRIERFRNTITATIVLCLSNANGTGLKARV